MFLTRGLCPSRLQSRIAWTGESVMPYELGDTVPLDATDLPHTCPMRFRSRLVWIDPVDRVIYRSGQSFNDGSCPPTTIDCPPQRYGDTDMVGVSIPILHIITGAIPPLSPPWMASLSLGSVEPVNQVPYQREFFQHCCTFAHELLVDFHPHAPRLRSEDAYNLAPDIELDTDSINRNRVGMRYYRGLIGYYYDKIVRFAALPRDADRRSQFYRGLAG